MTMPFRLSFPWDVDGLGWACDVVHGNRLCGCQVLGTDELNAYLNKYRLELDPHLEALVGR